MKSNGLNTYDEQLLPDEHIKIIKYALFSFFCVLIVSIVLSFFIKDFYTFLISFVLGSAISIILFYIIHKIVDSTYYLKYKSMIKKIHLIYQMCYIVSFVLVLVLLKTIYGILGLSLGLLIIKISTLLCSRKNN